MGSRESRGSLSGEQLFPELFVFGAIGVPRVHDDPQRSRPHAGRGEKKPASNPPHEFRPSSFNERSVRPEGSEVGWRQKPGRKRDASRYRRRTRAWCVAMVRLKKKPAAGGATASDRTSRLSMATDEPAFAWVCRFLPPNRDRFRPHSSSFH